MAGRIDDIEDQPIVGGEEAGSIIFAGDGSNTK
jgi:hypothetical protein